MSIEFADRKQVIPESNIRRTELESLPATLQNTYTFMRHGQSLANVEEIIISSLTNGMNAYGLTEYGKEQVRQSARVSRKNGISIDVMYTSPFLRCVESAREFAQTYGFTGKVVARTELRERNFGEFDGTSADNYSQVYIADQTGNNTYDVESPAQVLKRISRIIHQLESIHKGQNILLVTHADVGEIAQAGLFRIDPNLHRVHIPKFKNAELRKITAEKQSIQCVVYENMQL